MMYIKDGKVIRASQKAYGAIYKNQGYVPYEGQKIVLSENKPSDINENEPETDLPDDESKAPSEEPKVTDEDISDMNVPELKALAKEKGIEGYSSLTKPELLIVLKDVV